MQIGDVRAQPGEKVFGYADVARTPLFTMKLPVGIVRSRKDGPTLLITAGMHPSEYPGIEAAIRTFRDLQPDRITGTVIVIPIINTAGFEMVSSNTVPFDNVNLNRIMPGEPGGTISHALARYLTERVYSLADYVLDQHGGDLGEHLTPFALYHVTGNAGVDEMNRRMALAYQTRTVWRAVKDPYPGTAMSYLGKIGKPSVLGEAGGLGTYNEEDVAIHLRGARNIMRVTGVTDGEIEQVPGLEQTEFTKFWTVTATTGGIQYPMVAPGDELRKDQMMGVIKDIRGDVVEELRAPAHGRVRIHFPKRVVFPGQVVFRGFEYD